MMVAPFITVTGIFERKLPKDTCPSGIFIMIIPGLCSGGNVDPCNKAPRYLSFVQTEKVKSSGKLSEQINVEWYREEIILPFLTEIQFTLCGMNLTGYIPDKLAAVYWNNQLLS